MPTYLTHDKDRNYGLRRRVPDELRPIIGKREVWKSYGAVSFAEAKRRHASEVKAVADLFEQARQRLLGNDHLSDRPSQALPPPSEAQVRAAIMDWLYAKEQQSLDQDSQSVAEGRAEAVLDILVDDAAHLAGKDGEIAAEALLDQLLRSRGFGPPAADVKRRGTILMQRAMVEHTTRSMGRMKDLLGDHARDPLFADVLPLGASPQTVPAFEAAASDPPALPPLPAEELLAAWAAERRPAPATLRQYRISFAHLSRVTGFDDVRRIEPEHVIVFKAARLKEGRDPGTVADNVLACNAVCKWAVTNKLLKNSPFTGLAPRPGRKPQGVRDPYDDAEASRILIAARAESGWRRWLPWLLAFTGARIGEIAELRRRDVRVESGALILDIVPTETRQGKNATFQRMLPVHPAILAEGFESYLEQVPADGPLFPDLPANRLGRGHTAENNHRRWVRGVVGITDPRKAPSHSWRHRMEDQLRRIRAPEEVIDAITGRHNPRNAGAGYGKGFRRMPDELLKELVKLYSDSAGTRRNRLPRA